MTQTTLSATFVFAMIWMTQAICAENKSPPSPSPAPAPAAAAPAAAAAPTTGVAESRKITFHDFLFKMPDTAWETMKYAVSKDSLPGWAGVLGSTALLYYYDEDLYYGARNDGQRLGIASKDHTKTMLKGFGFDLVRLPTDVGSGLYFLGDGWTHAAIGFAFWVSGSWGGHTRAFNTGVEIFHGMVVSTIFSQAFKRASGRETPEQKTSIRGTWRPFPSIAAYQAQTPRYDAFPSGHVMTAALTFTIINTNYPEYFWYLAPIETLWLGALGFQMVNNGVHWASDYPLGLAIGYVVGKMSTRVLGGKGNETTKTASHWSFFPSSGPEGPMLNAFYAF